MTKPSTWGTTATLTTRLVVAVLGLSLLGLAVLLALSAHGAGAGYPEAVSTIVGAGLAALGLGGAIGTGAHAAQYVRTGSPTGSGPRGPVGAHAADPADRPPGEPAEVD